jgi:hypothetical protein
MELGAAFNAAKILEYRYTDIQNVIINTITLGMPAQMSKITEKLVQIK